MVATAEAAGQGVLREAVVVRADPHMAWKAVAVTGAQERARRVGGRRVEG